MSQMATNVFYTVSLTREEGGDKNEKKIKTFYENDNSINMVNVTHKSVSRRRISHFGK